jgi:Amt family ammonium transporter
MDLGGFCNGILAGLVSITAGCAFVKPWEAVLIGLIGGCVYQAASMALKRFKIDDVVDAFPVHGACGIWGVLALGFFGDEDEGMGGNGVFYGGDQLWTQVMGLVCIIAWTGCLCTAILLPLRQAGMLRWSDSFQEMGADVVEHSPRRSKTVSEIWANNTDSQAEGKVSDTEKIKPDSKPVKKIEENVAAAV